MQHAPAMTDIEFAQRLVHEAKPVLHVKHNVLGIPVKAFAPGEWGATEHEQGLDCVALQFDNGHCFVVQENQAEFVQLTEYEHAVFEGVVQSLRDVLTDAVTTLRSSDPKGERLMQTKAIIAASVAMQMRSLAT